jgi:single-stranded DNA-binding protein
MTAFCLISGTLFRAPEHRVSKAGKPYATATVKCGTGEALTWWRLTAFSESAIAELMKLGNGDAVSAQGAMSAELYRPDNGEPRLSLSIIADQVLALRQPKKSREKAAGEPNEPRRYDRAPDRYQRPSDPPRPARERTLAEQAANGGERFMHRHGGGADAELNDDLPW